jgi:hypothetical protein
MGGGTGVCGKDGNLRELKVGKEIDTDPGEGYKT